MKGRQAAGASPLPAGLCVPPHSVGESTLGPCLPIACRPARAHDRACPLGPHDDEPHDEGRQGHCRRGDLEERLARLLRALSNLLHLLGESSYQLNL